MPRYDCPPLVAGPELIQCYEMTLYMLENADTINIYRNTSSEPICQLFAVISVYISFGSYIEYNENSLVLSFTILTVL